MVRNQFAILTTGILLAALSGCAHGLPQGDRVAQDARKQGYYVTGDQALNRGGVAGYVPLTCSKGGWGLPSDSCLNEKPVSHAAPVAQTEKKPQIFKSKADEKITRLLENHARVELDVKFKTGSAHVQRIEEDEVATLASALKKSPKTKILIEGHTDSVGSKLLNDSLSLKRAQTVRQDLLARGVNADQVEAVGFGTTKPIADNHSARGRAKNRRVVAELISK